MANHGHPYLIAAERREIRLWSEPIPWTKPITQGSANGVRIHMLVRANPSYWFGRHYRREMDLWSQYSKLRFERCEDYPQVVVKSQIRGCAPLHYCSALQILRPPEICLQYLVPFSEIQFVIEYMSSNASSLVWEVEVP